MIENILHPIAIKYCQDEINEYCTDRTHYLFELDQWISNNLDIQNKLINEDLFIVAADVVALYPNINRNTLRNTLTKALNSQSVFCKLVFCRINYTYSRISYNTQHGHNFHNKPNGIITGDNHSVSLANIAMHFSIAYSKKAVVYKRFRQNIIFIASGENSAQI